ncbi:MAG TPA: hypothetical protein VHB99_17895, partial [Pirellulales bacterium]|nr:hypothetical protein [Pirellulales bacterium]
PFEIMPQLLHYWKWRVFSAGGPNSLKENSRRHRVLHGKIDWRRLFSFNWAKPGSYFSSAP